MKPFILAEFRREQLAKAQAIGRQQKPVATVREVRKGVFELIEPPPPPPVYVPPRIMSFKE